MSRMKEEMETVLVYNYADNTWDCYSNVPKHIRKLQSVGEMRILESEDDRPVAVRGALSEKQVSIKNVRVMTEEQKQKIADRFAKARES
jgi:hypothetical protein